MYIYAKVLVTTLGRDVIDPGKSYWENQLGTDVDVDTWQAIRLDVFKITILTKLRWFQFRLLSCKLVTNALVAKWDTGKTPLCTFCREEIENVPHLILKCKKVKTLWKQVCRWLTYVLKLQVQLQLTDTQIVFNNVKGRYAEVINIVILIVKQYIYASKCLEEELGFRQMYNRIQEYRKVEKIVAFKTGKMLKYVKKWENSSKSKLKLTHA